MRRRGGLVRTLIALIVAIPAVGCEVVSAPPGRPEAESSRTISADERKAMRTDEATAVGAVDVFWRRQFLHVFGREYQGPRVWGRYTGTDGPSCAGEPSVPFNAFYCRPGDFLAWDENLMAAGYSKIGDSWVYLVIAHEWGHAIQARLSRNLVSVAAELQADCLAGAALQGAANAGQIVIEPGDGEELAQTLAAVADDYPWTNESDHGNAQERTSAFNTGVRDGVQACI
jgi:predicted metalloprotease